MSPLLTNIFLHELDAYVCDVLTPLYTRNKSIQNFRNLKYDVAVRKSSEDFIRTNVQQTICSVITSAKKKLVEKVIRKVRIKETAHVSTPCYKKDCRLYYLRYGNDFVLGLTGQKKDTFYVLQLIIHFVFGLDLEIIMEKTNITHYSKGITFLGYNIRGDCTINNLKMKASYTNLKFTIPIKHLIERFKIKGFFRAAKKGKSQARLVARRVDK
jgi:hypothetical protein